MPEGRKGGDKSEYQHENREQRATCPPELLGVGKAELAQGPEVLGSVRTGRRRGGELSPPSLSRAVHM